MPMCAHDDPDARTDNPLAAANHLSSGSVLNGMMNGPFHAPHIYGTQTEEKTGMTPVVTSSMSAKW